MPAIAKTVSSWSRLWATALSISVIGGVSAINKADASGNGTPEDIHQADIQAVPGGDDDLRGGFDHATLNGATSNDPWHSRGVQVQRRDADPSALCLRSGTEVRPEATPVAGRPIHPLTETRTCAGSIASPRCPTRAALATRFLHGSRHRVTPLARLATALRAHSIPPTPAVSRACPTRTT